MIALLKKLVYLLENVLKEGLSIFQEFQVHKEIADVIQTKVESAHFMSVHAN